MSDPLSSSARALREMHDGSSRDSLATRGRVLAHAASRVRRRRVFAAAVAPLVLALVVSSAWAAVTGRMTHLMALIREPKVTAGLKGYGRATAGEEATST